MNPLIVIYSLQDQCCDGESNGQIERERESSGAAGKNETQLY